MASAKFELGRIVITPGALGALEEAQQNALHFLALHASARSRKGRSFASAPTLMTLARTSRSCVRMTPMTRWLSRTRFDRKRKPRANGTRKHVVNSPPMKGGDPCASSRRTPCGRCSN